MLLGLPVIIINPIPGQEEENADFLVYNNAGIWLKKEDNLKEVLTGIFNNSDKIKNLKKNVEQIAKKDSTKNICKILMNNF